MKRKALNRNVARAAVGGIAAVTATACLGATMAASANITNENGLTTFYESQYDSYEDVLRAGADLNLQLAAEGFVLMKNLDEALPLKKEETKVTVLGTAADEMATGGNGSGSQERPGNSGISFISQEAASVLDSLDAVGIQANPRVRERYLTVNSVSYTNGSNSLDREGGRYMEKVTTGGQVEFAGNQYKSIVDGTLAGVDGNLSLYDDAAIVVISRNGSEGSDNPSNNVPGHSDPTEHYLELDDAEKELMAYAKLHFGKVIVIINSPAVMELGCLEEDDGVSAVLWVGQPGWNGAMAIGQVLTGAVNPSGRLVDFYMKDFTTDPTWYNFGNYTQALYALYGEYTNDALGVSGIALVQMNNDPTGDVEYSAAEHAVDYAEGIYVGYRYYETVAAELGESGEAWYRDNVVYPFGYGLSYTQYTQEIVNVKGDLSDKNGTVTVSVKVKNVGSVAGKEVVQLYSTPPYTAGGIDKAAVNLVGYAKTDVIKAGRSQTVDIEVAVKDLASFDYSDANANGFTGYELETGSYILSVRSDSHTVLDSVTLDCASALAWDGDGDPDTPNAIYSQGLDSTWAQYNTLAYNWTVSGENHYLTRDRLVENGEVYDLKNLAWLLINDGEDNAFIDEAVNVLNSRMSGSTYLDYDNPTTAAVETDYGNPWLVSSGDIPSSWTQAAETGLDNASLYSMAGVAYGDAKWDEFLNSLTWEELVAAVSNSNFYTPAIESIGKEAVTDQDGPGQLKSSGNKATASYGWAWACEVVIASTWNTELAYEQGQIVGNESIWLSVNGWYGPGVNTHRNPLAGRNFEYYSQDGVQGGYIAAAVVKGATDMGCHVYMKHAFLNDQETNRSGAVTFVTEQAIREIYAKPLELAIRYGNANGTMSAYNLIGLSSSASYATNVQLYGNEWGYTGVSVTDAAVSGLENSGWYLTTLVRGYDTPLGDHTGSVYALEGVWSVEDNAVLVPATAAEAQACAAAKTAYTAALNEANEYFMNNFNPAVEEKFLPVLAEFARLQSEARSAYQTDVLGACSMVSYTQWYWVRETAHRLLYTFANGNGIKNGYTAGTFTDKEITFTVGVENSVGIVDSAVSDFFAGSGYILTGVLPEGLSFDSVNGAIAGIPAKSALGTTEVEVTVVGKYGLGWISDTATVTVNVVMPAYGEGTEASLTFTPATGVTADADGFYALNVGDDYGETALATVAQNVYTFRAFDENAVNRGFTDDDFYADANGLYARWNDAYYAANGRNYEVQIGSEANGDAYYHQLREGEYYEIQHMMENDPAFFGGSMNGCYSAYSLKSGVKLYAPGVLTDTLANSELYRGVYFGTVYSASGLPAGLAVDPVTGEIKGTVKAAGTFYAELTVTFVYLCEDFHPWPAGGPRYSVETESFSSFVAFRIGGGWNVTFDANYAGGNDQYYGVADGGTVTGAELAANVADPVRAGGYAFLGWATSADATAPDVTFGDGLVLSSETTYYAVWQLPDVSVVDGYLWLYGENTGIRVGAESDAAQRGTDGRDGDNGTGIVSIEKTASENRVDTYTITLSNGETATFTVTNGADGSDGKDGADGQNGADGKDGRDGANAESSGCGGAMGAFGGIVGLGVSLAIVATAAVASKKRKE